MNKTNYGLLRKDSSQFENINNDDDDFNFPLNENILIEKKTQVIFVKFNKKNFVKTLKKFFLDSKEKIESINIPFNYLIRKNPSKYLLSFEIVIPETNIILKNDNCPFQVSQLLINCIFSFDAQIIESNDGKIDLEFKLF